MCTVLHRALWNHLQLDQPDIAEVLNECNVIKYAAYRVAAKLRVLQRTMHMEKVRLGLVTGVLDRHHFHKTENEIMVDNMDLDAVLHDIFFAAQKENQCDINVDVCTDLMTNFLLDVYDRDKQKSVQLISAKTCLVVLCSSSLQEKYQYLFHQFADHNSCISKKKLARLLKNFTDIITYLSESSSFGETLIPGSVMSCFENSVGPLGVTEDDFLSWLVQEPQLLVWHSSFFRMQVAESVSHSAKCNACKMYPIVGLRYHCLRCLKYDLCQTCFFMGKFNKRHKPTHPMEEYCSKVSSRDSTMTFLKILKNKLCGTSSDLHYLPIHCASFSYGNRNAADQLRWSSNCNVTDDNVQLSSDIELSTKTSASTLPRTKELQPHCELQSIIGHLEEDIRHLQLDVGTLSSEKNIALVDEYLSDHRKQIEAQIKRLKQLKVHLLQMRPYLAPHPLERLESTPVLPAAYRFCRQCVMAPNGMDNLSPIMREEDETKHSMECKKLQLTNANSNCNVVKLPANVEKLSSQTSSLSECSATDLSTWLGDQVSLDSVTAQSGLSTWLQDTQETSGNNLNNLHEVLDQILERLQSMLSSNQDNVAADDNVQLQKATTEIENLLTNLVDEVENKKRRCKENMSRET